MPPSPRPAATCRAAAALTVGVAGLIQSGGFGSFSKRYGMAAASLLEAEVVTADGAVRIANACTNPDLFWGLEGRRRRQPRRDHAAHAARRTSCRRCSARPSPRVKANSDAAFRRLIERFIAFYRDSLFNPTWGETVTFRPDNVLEVTMVFQGLDQDARCRGVAAVLRLDPASRAATITLVQPPMFIHVPARSLWDAAFLKQNAPQMVLSDERPGASATNVFWRTNLDEAGWFLHAYQSTWLPAALLGRRPARSAGRRAVRQHAAAGA